MGVKLHDNTKQNQKIVSYNIILCKIDGKERGACLMWLRWWGHQSVGPLC